MAETQTKPTDIDQVDEVEVPKPKKARAKKEDKTPEQELDEQIATFEPVAKAVDRKLTLDDGQGNTNERVYVQHEMGFMTKLKFFRSLSKAIKHASDDGGINFLNEFFTPGDIRDSDAMVSGLLALVEAVPEFIEEAYCFALSVPAQEQAWAILAFDNLTDEEGIDILEVFIAQNGDSIRDFFTQKLPKLGKRIQAMVPQQGQ